ncbi:outer membrane beta-barrel family protein [Riemerella anatipestifer]|uniref:outer membrane beta-barrel family protein n=1 Tax=Riemerella anatipestifer TaxID=34085 RepID=UPI002854930C|nr:outer membrane beta-barrel family protein [Riemerella anatipestifer]MDR7818773.1 outer membrane beta-barrel family protein [Riemerella anatipestifer]MDR7850863.1 outer membrane beta-barrel family protein [Riemerella anatipestifer]MDR7881321.1 outer membrane beta-barrel family protein [Riemerella anatipestifer]
MRKTYFLLGILVSTTAFSQTNSKTDSTKTKKLEEVTITKKFIQQKSDRMVYNVAASPAAKGNTVLELLQKTPTVTTTDGKEFKILGKSSTTIFINGRKANMNADALLALLKSTPSENISKIEVISVPGSEYNVEGDTGIINIVMKKKNTDGFNGVLRMENEQAFYNNTSSNLSLNYRKNKLGISTSLGYSEDNYKQKFTIENGTSTTKTLSLVDIDMPSQRTNFNITADYELTEKSNLNFSFNSGLSFQKEGKTTSNNQDFINGNLFQIRPSEGLEKENTQNFSTALNYDLKTDKNGSILKINLSHLKFNRQNNSNLLFYSGVGNNAASLNSAMNQEAPQNINNTSGFLDYIWKLKDNSTLSVGGNFGTTKTDNNTIFDIAASDLVFYRSNALSNHFIYQEKIGAFYTNYERNFGEKLSTKVGLRYEMTATQGDVEGKNDPYYHFKNNYSNLLPFLNLAYQANDNHSISYSFSSRVRRPSFWELNPVRMYTTETNFGQNNPFMKASTSYNQQLMYMFKSTYFLSLSQNYTKDAATQIPLQKTTGNITELRYIRTNYGNKNQLSASIGMQKAFFNGRWMGSFNATGVYTRFSGSVSKDPLNQEVFPTYVVDRTTEYIVLSSNNQIALNKAKNLWLDVDYFWISKQKMEIGTIGALQKLDLSIKKNWENWTFRFTTNDVFNTMGYIRVKNQQENGYISDATQRQYNRTYAFSVTYNFGNQKVKKVKKNENSNNDIQNRIGK